MRAPKRLAALLLGTLLLASCAGCADSAPAAAAGTPLIRDGSIPGKTTTYNLQTVEPTEVKRTATMSASPSYQMIKSVSSGPADCRLMEVLVTRGQHVEAGDPIAVLQGTGSQADVELKKLEIQAFESGKQETLAWYRSSIEAAEALPQETESQQRVRALRLEYANLEYEKYRLQADYTLETMRAQLKSLEDAVGEKTLTAPITGTVRSMSLRAAPGDVLPAGTEICRVYGDAGMLVAGMNSSGTFIYGREVTFTCGRGKNTRTVSGRVICSPEVYTSGYGNNMILMELDLDGAEFPDQEGSVETSFTVLTDVYAVPKNCLTNRDGVSYVQLLIDDCVRTRPVVRGPMAGSMVAVFHGLHEGDQVVISSYNS